MTRSCVGKNHSHKKGEGGHGCGRGDHHTPGTLEDQGSVTGKKKAGSESSADHSLGLTFVNPCTASSSEYPLRHPGLPPPMVQQRGVLSCPSFANANLQHILSARLHCLKGTTAGGMILKKEVKTLETL